MAVSKITNRLDVNPSFPFYPNDWTGDDGLQVCSLAARGLWIEMLNIMWKAPIRGTLTMIGNQANVKQVSSKALARKVGSDEQTVEELLSELEASGVYSTLDSGTIYNRRMYRQAQANLKRVESGRKGGLKAQAKRKHGPSSSSSSSEEEENSNSLLPLSVDTDAPAKKSLNEIKNEIQSAWNAMAPEFGLPRFESWNEDRTKHLRARIRSTYWRENWRAAIDRVPESPWNLGENPSGWLANVDWFLRDKTVPKLMESAPKQKKSTIEGIAV